MDGATGSFTETQTDLEVGGRGIAAPRAPSAAEIVEIYAAALA